LQDPLTYAINVDTLALTEVYTDAKAGIRVIIIEGGVFMKGNLVKAAADPKVALAHNLVKKYTSVTAKWCFWINAFQYKCEFIYRTWSF